MVGTAKPLLCRRSGRGPDCNHCSCLDSKRTKCPSKEREYFGRNFSPVAGEPQKSFLFEDSEHGKSFLVGHTSARCPLCASAVRAQSTVHHCCDEFPGHRNRRQHGDFQRHGCSSTEIVAG